MTTDKPNTRLFAVAALEAGCFPCCAPDGWTRVAEQVTDTSRWTETHTVILAGDGAMWAVDYKVGLTERQEDTPMFSGDTVVAYRVHTVERTVVEFRRADTGRAL